MNENDTVETTPRTLTFTCPECGGHTLKQFDDNPYFWECEVSVWLEDKDDPDTVEVEWDSEPVYTRRGDPMNEPGWCCANCDMVLCYESGSYIGTDISLAEWLLEHCCNEEEMATPEEEDEED